MFICMHACHGVLLKLCKRVNPNLKLQASSLKTESLHHTTNALQTRVPDMYRLGSCFRVSGRFQNPTTFSPQKHRSLLTPWIVEMIPCRPCRAYKGTCAVSNEAQYLVFEAWTTQSGNSAHAGRIATHHSHIFY